MRVLGIDPGEKNIGLALMDEGVIETLPVLIGPWKKSLSALGKVAVEEEVEKIVIGISQGKSAQLSQKFATELGNILKLPIVLTDETLTTFEAKKLRPREKRVDSVAAAFLLKNYWEKEGGKKDV